MVLTGATGISASSRVLTIWSTVFSEHHLATASLRGSSCPTRFVQPPTAALLSPVAIRMSRLAIALPEAEMTTWPSFAL